jgi:hypothetical protein
MGFTEHLRIVTASNCSDIAHAKSSQSAVSSPAARSLCGHVEAGETDRKAIEVMYWSALYIHAFLIVNHLCLTDLLNPC